METNYTYDGRPVYGLPEDSRLGFTHDIYNDGATMRVVVIPDPDSSHTALLAEIHSTESPGWTVTRGILSDDIDDAECLTQILNDVVVHYQWMHGRAQGEMREFLCRRGVPDAGATEGEHGV